MRTLIPIDDLQWSDDIFYQKILNENQCLEILEEVSQCSEFFESGSVSKDGVNVLDKELKITQELMLDDHIHVPKVKQLYKMLETPVIKFVNNILASEHDSIKYLKGFKLYNGRFRFKHYPKGIGKYGWHLDMGGEWGKRLMTVLLYLNNVKEGGQTQFSNQDCEIPCMAGAMCAFPPYWNYPHRSVENISDDKNILALFIETS